MPKRILCLINTFLILIVSLSIFDSMVLAQDSSGVRCIQRIVNNRSVNLIASNGNYLCALVNNQVKIFDISIPNHPHEISSIPIIGDVKKFILTSNRLYLANDFDGIRIYSLTDPYNPALITTYRLPDTAIDMALQNDHLYLNIHEHGLLIIDVGDSQNLRLLGSLDSINFAYFVVSGRYLYGVGCCLWTYDISNPDSIQLMSEYELPYTWVLVSITKVGSNVYLGGQGTAWYTCFGILIGIDVSDPTNPVERGRFYEPAQGSREQLNSYSNINQVTNIGNNVVVSAEISERQYNGSFRTSNIVQILDITNPDSIESSWGVTLYSDTTYYRSRAVRELSVTESTIYCAEGELGLASIPTRTNSYSTSVLSFQPRLITHIGNYLVASTNNQISISDISDPAHASLDALIDVSDSIEFLGSFNNTLLLGTAHRDSLSAINHEMVLYNLSNINTPVHLSNCEVPAQIQDIAIDGAYAYVATGDSGMKIVNIANPQSIQITGSMPVPTDQLEISDHYLFALNKHQFRSYRLTDPIHPELISEFSDTSLVFRNLAVIGNRLYYCEASSIYHPDQNYYNSQAFIREFNISDPTHLVPMRSYMLAEYNSAYHAFLNARFLIPASTHLFYQSDFLGTINILDLTRPDSIRRCGYYHTNGYGSTVIGNNIFLTRDYSIDLFDCSQALGVVDHRSESIPTTFALKPNNPNPFNATTEIHYTIPATAKVELKVFDLTGREVAKLVDFNQNPGEYTYHFDGKALASGTYFVRLKVGAFMQTQKIILLK